jgi:hypothetical protein
MDKHPQLDELDALSLAERGLARECSDEYLQPQPGKLSRYIVQRSRDHKHFWLVREGGEFVMYAEVRTLLREVCFFSYDPDDRHNGLFDPEKPAFRMEFDDSKRAFVLSRFLDGPWYSPRDSCQGERRQEEVLFVEHSTKTIGDGINYCLNAEFKTVCSDVVNKFSTRQAEWNDEMQELVFDLDFKDREVVSSAKNFLLVQDESPNRIVCQHGKVSSNTFALDFEAPLSVARAFAMSVTTLFWE